MKRRYLRNDILLAAVILLIAAAGFFRLRTVRQPGAYAAVKIDGSVTARYPLSRDAEIPLFTGENGEGRNLLVIRDGKAEIAEANCPDEICVKTRAASYVGETIVCLPHRLVVEIAGEDSLGLDAAV